jgi:DNA-binding XRE family transcriptional regulator
MSRRVRPKSKAVVSRRKKIVTYVTVEREIASCGPVYTALAEVIRNRRMEIGMTQEGTAKQLGMSRPSLANIESGRQRVYLDDVFAMARVLSLEPRALFAKLEAELIHHEG